MSKKRLQTRVAISRFALPAVAAFAAVVCAACGLADSSLWPAAGALVVSGFLMMELNNANALIRIYSRMVSCSYLMMSCAACFLLKDFSTGAAQVALAAFYLLLFRAYQDKQAVGSVFYAFALLGIGSFWFVQLLWFVPLLWILLYSHVLAGSWRTFFASLFGLLIPYWFLAGYHIYAESLPELLAHFEAIAAVQPLGLPADWTTADLLSTALVVVAFLTGAIHFHRNSYMDKIRTRMLYEVFTTMAVACIVLAALQPQHHHVLLGMLIVNTAPLVGHFIALTHTRLTNIAFLLLLTATLAITYYNVWNF